MLDAYLFTLSIITLFAGIALLVSMLMMLPKLLWLEERIDAANDAEKGTLQDYVKQVYFILLGGVFALIMAVLGIGFGVHTLASGTTDVDRFTNSLGWGSTGLALVIIMMVFAVKWRIKMMNLKNAVPIPAGAGPVLVD